MKKLLFILQQSPYRCALAYEAIEALLLAASYPFALSVLFRNDGIFQLLQKQDSKLIQQKNISKLLSALPEFDVEQLYVSAADLKNYPFALTELILPVKPLLAAELSTLLKSQDAIMNF